MANFIHFLRTAGELSPRVGHKHLPPKYLRMSKPTDMTIHWKALDEHFMMLTLVFRFNHFWGEMHFLTFSQKTSVLKEL
jgi:hypothetical protein